MTGTDAPSSSGGLDGAADRIRETAKWLTLGLAAIGGVLVAGTQLSDIGQLEQFSPRFWVAAVGGALAIAGCATVLWQTVSIATSQVVTLHSLTGSVTGDVSSVTADPLLLGGYQDPKSIEDAYEKALADRRALYAAYTDNPTSESRERAAVADAAAVSVSGIAKVLVQVASYTALAERWREARTLVVVGGVAAACGISIFAWAANPPPDVAGSVVTPGTLKGPVPGAASLSAESRGVLAAALGEGCRLDEPLTVLVLGQTDAGPDILVQQSGCSAIRLVLVPAWGSVRQ